MDYDATRSGIFLILLSLLFIRIVPAQGFGDRLVLDPALAPFYHGVASGDPLTDRVIIWTRVTTAETEVFGIWRTATDSMFTQNVQDGIWSTDASKDYTVKVDVTGLSEDTWYYYEFEALGSRSVRGRTKTLPSSSIDNYRLVFVNCSDFNTGYYNVYSRIRERNDFDAVYHLGDYIYEYEDSRYISSGLKVRDIEPLHELITLADYRTRYNFYRLDPELRKLHQQYPWIVTWDDHETANNSWFGGAVNHNPDQGEGVWNDRKTAGSQSFIEWMPIRESDTGDPLDIYRGFKVGDLAEIYVIESRLSYRSLQDAFIATFPQFDQANRGILGPTQFNWLKTELMNSTRTWQVMVSPVPFSTLLYGTDPNIRAEDPWDGYPLQRNLLLSHLDDNDIDNFTVISGDLHQAFAMDIPRFIENPNNPQNYNPATGEGSIGVNFVGTASSSVLCCRNTNPVEWAGNNPHMKYQNLVNNGYCLLDITHDLMTCDYWFVDTVSIAGDTSHWWEASLCVEDGEMHLDVCAGPSQGDTIYFPFAPCGPRAGGDTIDPVGTIEHLGDITGVHPLPASEAVGVQFFLQNPGDIYFEVIGLRGQIHLRESYGQLDRGIHYRNLLLHELPPGQYILSIRDGNRLIASRKIIRM